MFTERKHHLLLVLDNLFTAQQEWIEADTPYITEDFETAVENAISVFNIGDIPSDMRVATERMDELGRQWEDYKLQAETKSDPMFLPNDAFWKILDQLRGLRENARPKPKLAIESIDELTKQGVSDRQICVIYGWTDRNDQAELWRLQEERKAPGKHTGEGFVHPLERRRIEEEKRQKEIVEQIRQKRIRKTQRKTTPPPESLEQLVSGGVSTKQIANILGCSVEEVHAKCKAAGLELPMDNYDPTPTSGINEKQVRKMPPGTGRAIKQEPSVDETEDETGDEPDDYIADDEIDDIAVSESFVEPAEAKTIEQEVIGLHGQGFDDTAICNAVGCGKRQVWKILKDYKKELEEKPATAAAE